MGLSFTIAAGLRQRIHSGVRVLWDSRPYFTASDSRLPFLSPPTTRRATVEVFDSASSLPHVIFLETLMPWSTALLEKPVNAIPCVLWRPKVQCRVHNGSPLIPTLS
jgi:hypothetical protein